MTGSAGVFAGRMDAAPEGRLNFAQYEWRWDRWCHGGVPSPVGTVEQRQDSSFVPKGLACLAGLFFPAINRWAILIPSLRDERLANLSRTLH